MGFPCFLLDVFPFFLWEFKLEFERAFFRVFFFSCLIFLELCLYLVLVDTRGVQKIERRVLWLRGLWLHFEANPTRRNGMEHCQWWTPLTRLRKVTYSDFLHFDHHVVVVVVLYWVHLYLSQYLLPLVHHRLIHIHFWPIKISLFGGSDCSSISV